MIIQFYFCMIYQHIGQVEQASQPVTAMPIKPYIINFRKVLKNLFNLLVLFINDIYFTP